MALSGSAHNGARTDAIDRKMPFAADWRARPRATNVLKAQFHSAAWQRAYAP
jgi:hypothetical protein